MQIVDIIISEKKSRVLNYNFNKFISTTQQNMFSEISFNIVLLYNLESNKIRPPAKI